MSTPAIVVCVGSLQGVEWLCVWVLPWGVAGWQVDVSGRGRLGVANEVTGLHGIWL